MNRQQVWNSLTTYRDLLRNDTWTLAATGMGATALSSWVGVIFDDVVEPSAEIIATGVTAATAYLGRTAYRKYQERQAAQVLDIVE